MCALLKKQMTVIDQDDTQIHSLLIIPLVTVYIHTMLDYNVYCVQYRHQRENKQGGG